MVSARLVDKIHITRGQTTGVATNDFSATSANSRQAVTNRGIGTDVLGDASGLAGRVVEDVAEDAAGAGLLGVLAGAAGKLQLVCLGVLLGVQHVGALGAEAKGDLLELPVGGGGVVGRRGLGGGHGEVGWCVFACGWLLCGEYARLS